jgi:hypothetical protein
MIYRRPLAGPPWFVKAACQRVPPGLSRVRDGVCSGVLYGNTARAFRQVLLRVFWSFVCAVPFLLRLSILVSRTPLCISAEDEFASKETFGIPFWRAAFHAAQPG